MIIEDCYIEENIIYEKRLILKDRIVFKAENINEAIETVNKLQEMKKTKKD